MLQKVLVVDDSMSLRRFMRGTLVEQGLEVVEAANGQEAIEVFQREAPDIVFLDITMPVMDGFETLPRLRELSASTPVVVLTADIQSRTVERILDLGAFLFLKKPPQKALVLDTLEQCREVIGS